MATTTPNYGWAVPTSTDLVKDGATAIETLGDAIDASMNTALGTKKAGMVLLNTTSFSGVTSQSINDVFSTTYKNYKIVTEIRLSSVALLDLRLRVSGADNTTSNYKRTVGFFSSGGTTGSQANTNTGTSFAVVGAFTSNSADFEIALTNPFQTQKTSFTSAGSFNVSAGNAGAVFGGGQFDATTSFTGFTIYSDVTNAMTGSVKVYGFNE